MSGDVPIVTAAVILDQGRILIARRNADDHQGGCWEFPGGTLQPGETREQCLARELLEELGVGSTIGRLIDHAPFRSGGEEIELYFYEAQLHAHRFVLTAHQETRWVDPAELAAYGFAEPDRQAVGKVLPGGLV